MANWVSNGMTLDASAAVGRVVESFVNVPFVRAYPLLYALGFNAIPGFDKLGVKTGAVFGGGGTANKSKLTEMLGSARHEFLIEAVDTDDGDTVQPGDPTPTATSNYEDALRSWGTVWTRARQPVRVDEASKEDAKGKAQLVNVAVKAAESAMRKAVRRFNNEMWLGALDQTGQSQRRWKHLLGVQYALTANNFYGGVDRSTAEGAVLNPMSIDASTDLPSTVIDLEIIDSIISGYANAGTGAEVEGLSQRDFIRGEGPTLHFCRGSLWQVLRNQAKGHYQIFTNGIPNHPFAGYTRPVIQYGQHWIFPDNTTPAGCLASIHPSTVWLEFAAGNNFRWTGWKNKAELEEGGAEYDWGNVIWQSRLTFESPFLNCLTKNLTTR